MVSVVSCILSILVVALGPNSVLGQSCGGSVTRMEIRSMSSSQLQAYANAIKKLHNGTNDQYTQFSNIHSSNSPQAHGVPAFFPWHRYFLRQYELALQKIDPSVVLPYWDWTIDSQAPERSAVLSGAMFGGNGQGSNYCVANGFFSGWQTNYPSSHCLTRQYSGGSTIPAFYSPVAIESILTRSTSFDQIRQSVENGPHGVVHTGIGGNNGDLSFMYSPNDPIFYLHHAFVDLLWNEWQMRNPSLAGSYNGGNGVSTSNNMSPFNVPVSTVMSTSFGCYSYPRWSGASPPPVPSSSSSITPSSTSTPTATSTTQQQQQQPTSTASPPSNSNPSQPTTLFNPFGSFPTQTFTQPNLPTFGFPSFQRRQFDIANVGSAGSLSNYIKSLVASVPKLIKIDPNDRTTPNKIRTPAPLPDAYIASNGLNLQAVRANELMLANLVEAINALQG